MRSLQWFFEDGGPNYDAKEVDVRHCRWRHGADPGRTRRDGDSYQLCRVD